MRRGLAVPALALVLAACGPSDDTGGPGGVSPGEAQALNDAADALDANVAATVDPDAPLPDADDAAPQGDAAPE